MTDSISARHDAALEGIAAAGREIAEAIRGFHDTAALAKEATVLSRRAAEHERRMDVLEGEISGALTEAERERDEARAEVERLRAALGSLAANYQTRADFAPTPEAQWAAVAADVRRVLDDGQAQDAASVPAEQPQGESGGSGAPGGLGHHLRVLATGQTRALRKRLRTAADDADRLESERAAWQHQAEVQGRAAEGYAAQVDAIRAAIKREAGHGDAITRCNLVAERFQTVLDGVTNGSEVGT